MLPHAQSSSLPEVRLACPRQAVMQKKKRWLCALQSDLQLIYKDASNPIVTKTQPLHHVHYNKRHRPLCRVTATPNVARQDDLAEISMCPESSQFSLWISMSLFLPVHNLCKTQQGGDTRSRNADKPNFSSGSGWPKGNLCGLKKTREKGQNMPAGIAKINEPITSSLKFVQRSAEPKTEHESWNIYFFILCTSCGSLFHEWWQWTLPRAEEFCFTVG